MYTKQLLLAAAIAGTVAGEPTHAQTSTDQPPVPLPSLKLEPFSVIGNAEQAEQLPGSAHYIDSEELDTFEHADVLRVLRQIPGVYIQEEDGLGLRPNIGIRGSGSNRSSRITLMEDGVLAAPAPYAASSAYYFPTMRRMNAVEVLKGPAAISEGPRTTGGALNLVSTPIPEGTAGRASVLFGQDDTVDTHAWLGASSDNAGWLVETVQQDSSGFKTLPSGADTGTRLEDYLVKLRVNADPGADWYQSLELKLGRTEQDGNETYLGLTDEDFEQTPFARYPASQRDNIVTEHDLQQLTYRLEPAGAGWQLDATLYNNEFARNWFKLGSVNGVGISSLLDSPDAFADEMAWVRGANSPDDAFNLRNNNREHHSRGVQGNPYFDADTGDCRHQFRFGMRYHRDQEDRLQDEGWTLGHFPSSIHCWMSSKEPPSNPRTTVVI
jgi:Fe(3+) dicitrate transport protein